MVGGAGFVDGCVEGMFLGAPFAGTDLTGAGILATLRSAVEDFCPIEPGRIASFPCDGEMVMRCKPHAEDILGVSNAWFHLPWDLAHGFELACKDAKNELSDSGKWLQSLQDEVTAAGKTYGWGKI